MNLKRTSKNSYCLALILELLLCDCVQSYDSSTFIMDENYINNDQSLKYEVISSASVDLLNSPKKIGEIEFDVEVHEVLPQQEYATPPEIGFISESINDTNHESRAEVITNVAVDLVSSPRKVGDIELDIEVDEVVPQDEETRAPEIVVIPQKGDTLLPDFSLKDKNFDFSQTIEDFVLKDTNPVDSSPHESALTDTTPDESALTNTTSSDSAFNDSTSSDTVLDTVATYTPITTGLTDNGKETESVSEPFEVSKQTDKSKERSKDSFSIWPVIIVAVIFIIFVLVGLYWAITSFCKIKSQENDEEKQIAASSSKSAAIQPKPDSNLKSTTPDPIPKSTEGKENPIVGEPQDLKDVPSKSTESLSELSVRSETTSSLEGLEVTQKESKKKVK